MSMLRNKLKEKSGASIFMGLIFLLVCLMVGAVALAASTAAAGKLAQQRQIEQDYLTVASAARLVRNRIGASVYTYKTTSTKITTTTSEGSTSSVSSPAITEELTSTGTLILEQELKELCKAFVPGSTVSPSKRTFTIDLTTGTSPEWAKVYGTLSVKEDGTILVKLWLGVAEETNAQNHNRMAMEFLPDGPATQTQTTSTETTDPISGEVTSTETTTITTTCSWPEGGCTITKGT